ncbi:MAG: pyridoxamine 5'-phosphate oxidase family protein [Acidobacteriota bacterium]
MTEKRSDDDIAKLYDLVEDIDVAMMVTRREDGNLVSRPMANQVRSGGADFWFAAAIDSDKIANIRHDPHVNLTYYKDRTREWVSIAGTAEISQDRDKIRELYRPDWKMWFSMDAPADPRAGTPDDPRIALIGVHATSARFMKHDVPEPVVLFEVVRGLVTGKPPDIGTERTVAGKDLKR